MSFIERLIKIPATLLLVAGLSFGVVSAAHAQAETAKPAAPVAIATDAAKPAPVALDNPYGLKAIIEHGDLVSKGVLGLLMIMSMGTWIVLAMKVLEQRKLLREAKGVGAGSAFWTAGSLQKGAESLDKEGAFRFIADTALEASKRHDGVLAGVDLGSWISTSLEEAGEEVEHRMQKGLGFLATVGSTSPFIGLFGTVWGIMDAFRGLGVTKSSSIQAVAPGISEALIATAVGLSAAIPAVMAYNYFSRQNRVLTADMENFSAEFLNIAERHFL